MTRIPRRFLVRYRKPGESKWRRVPRFITPVTGFRTRMQAQAKLDALEAKGYAGHIDTYDNLRVLALAEARKLIGVMEHGGNNRGAKVEEIIRANEGVVGEPWCGDFCAYIYRRAGSKAVTRSWAAVRLFSNLAGVKTMGKRNAQPGDLVRFTFDHIGVVEGYCNQFGRSMPASTATHMRTIEGNTGASGAVSDSRTGGDGVYRKRRPLSQVRDTILVQK